MYLTTGASSTSDSSSIDACGAPSSRPTSMSSRFAISLIVVLALSRILAIAAPSLSSSTTIGSGTRLVLKRTSSSACRLAGSDTAT